MKKKIVRSKKSGLVLGAIIVAVLAVVGGLVVHTALASTGKPPIHSGNNKDVVRTIRHGSHLIIDSTDLARLERLGHDSSDIYTALNLQERTGVPIESWLDARKAGKSWEVAIKELAKGLPLKRPPVNAAASRELTTEEVKQLMIEGYSGADVIAVGELVYLYGGDPLALLQLRQQGIEWAELRAAEEEKWLQSPERAVSLINFGTGMTHSPGGLSKEEIVEIHFLGYSLNDVMLADRLAGLWGLDLLELVKSFNRETTLEAAVQAHYQRLTLSEQVAALQNRRIGTPIIPGEEVDMSRVVRIQFAEGFTTPSGLSGEEVSALVMQGHDMKELMSADARAHALGLDIRELAATKGDKSWNDVFDLVLGPKKPLEYVPVQPDEDKLIAAYSAVRGQALGEVTSLRASGKTWRELTGISPERFAHALGTAQGWGLTDQTLVLQALLQGLRVEDAYQAALLAPATKLNASEILTLKTVNNTWRDVIEEIMPDKVIPPITDNEQPGELPSPPKLPVKGGN